MEDPDGGGQGGKTEEAVEKEPIPHERTVARRENNPPSLQAL
jgi:hypothetical protein